jgi:WD40 repeat protein
MMRRRLLATPLAISLLFGVTACAGTHALHTGASCPEGARALAEAVVARAGGYLFRALARAEAADRACTGEATRREVAALRAELFGRPGAPAPTPSDVADVRAAAVLRLAGDPVQALAKLGPIRARLDAAGLAELARIEAAGKHAAGARFALEQAAGRAEQRAGGRGRWRWQRTGFEKTVQLVFSRDGARLVSADRAGLIRIWDTAGGYELRSLQAHGWPNSLDISPDGRWIAAAGGNGPVEVWNAATGERVLDLQENAPAVFASDGHLLVSTNRREGILELEVPSGTQVAQIGAGWPHNIVVAGDRIYATGEDGSRKGVAFVWERGGAHRELAQIPLPDPSIWGMEVTPGGELIVQLREKLAVIDARGAIRRSFDGNYSAMALTPDGKRLVASTAAGGIDVFDLATGKRLRHAEQGPDWSAVAVDPRGVLLATANADGIALASFATGEITARFGRPTSALALAFDADGRRLAVGTASGTAAIWDLADGRVSAVAPRAGAPVIGVAFGPGGVLATASGPPGARLLGRQGGQPTMNSTLAVWDPGGAKRWSKELEQLLWIGYQPGTDTLASASMITKAFSAWIGVATWDGRGVEQQRLAPESRGPFAWSPDGARLAYGGSGIVLAPADGSEGGAVLDVAAERIAYQPAGGLLAAAGADGRISLWDAATQRPERVLLDESGAVTGLAWSPSGGVLASAAARTVRLWDPRGGARLATLEAHAAVTAIAFRPDGRLLAAACDDGIVELWSVADAKLVVMLALPGDARGLVLAPDGAADGPLSDDDPLYWVIGDTVLHGRAVWDREAKPGLLPARLAAVPAETAPRAGLPGAAPPPAPPACFTAVKGHARTLVSATPPDERSLSLCVEADADIRGHKPGLPACFVVDLATGAYRPRALTPREALGKEDPSGATATIHGRRATVCRAGACRELTIAELPEESEGEPNGAVDDAGTLFAVVVDQGQTEAPKPRAGSAVVYDVATGRRLRKLALPGMYTTLAFAGGTLLVTHTPCAGPCSSSDLVDPRTGRRLGAVGGAKAFNTSELTPAQVTGNVYAFNDWDSPTIVYQDVKTGRVVRRFEMPAIECGTDDGSLDVCMPRMVHAGSGVALVSRGTHSGDLTLLDARGKVTGSYKLPVCKP